MTYQVSCSECGYEDTVESLDEVFEVEKEHQRSERLSHVLQFERLGNGVD